MVSKHLLSKYSDNLSDAGSALSREITPLYIKRSDFPYKSLRVIWLNVPRSIDIWEHRMFYRRKMKVSLNN